MPKNISIDKQKLIICEGRDEELFLNLWLKSDALSYEPKFANDIQVIDFGGNQNLHNALANYKLMAGFNALTHLMIIRDAEKNSAQAVQSIKTALRNNQFQAPEKPAEWCKSDNNLYIGFILFPNCSCKPENGTLEDLCIRILAQPDAELCMNEVNQLILRLEEQGKNFNHKFKTQLHAYFAVSDNYVGMKIGEAAKANAFNWSSNNLNTLKNFVGQMILQ